MPALIKTEFRGEVVYLGSVNNRNASLASTPKTTMHLDYSGDADEAHSGLTRLSCSRVRQQYDVGTEIRNTRQISIVSIEEMDKIAANMGLPALEPQWVGASIVIKGIPDLTLLPPSSRLQFASGATITVDIENRPCVLPAKVIEESKPGFGKLFKPAAQNLRGIVGWVECVGEIDLGDEVELHIPIQRTWPHLAKIQSQEI